MESTSMLAASQAIPPLMRLGGTEFLTGLVGLVLGAGLAILFVRSQSVWLTRRKRDSFVQEFDATRRELLRELAEMEEQLLKPLPPIRMVKAERGEEQRRAA
jgi:hypothetical protein